MSSKHEFVEAAREGKVLAKRCSRCDLVQLGTVYFCSGCGSRSFESVVLDGRGKVATYTIITVPPAGFEKYTPYAWVVIELDGHDIRISGFMAGVASPTDLPIGTGVRITGFDERGILLEKGAKI